MPRTKGAKNKEKPLEFYLKKVQELGGNVPAEIKEKVSEKIESTPVAKKTFEIAKPKKEKEKENSAPNPEGEVYRCGNPACGKILSGAVNKCPFCGVNLQWQ
jgi:rubrerythrin